MLAVRVVLVVVVAKEPSMVENRTNTTIPTATDVFIGPQRRAARGKHRDNDILSPALFAGPCHGEGLCNSLDIYTGGTTRSSIVADADNIN